MAILNKIFGRNAFKSEGKAEVEHLIDTASKEYLEKQRLAASDTRILL